MIYRDMKRHLVADSLEELHAFAAKVGIKRHWFDPDPRGGKPHYDIPVRMTHSKVFAETQLVSSREILRLSKLMVSRRAVERFSRMAAESPEIRRAGVRETMIVNAIRSQIPTATDEQCSAIARRIMSRLNVEEPQLC